MIQVAIDRFIKAKPKMEAFFSAGHPENYKAIVRAVIDAITEDRYGSFAPDPDRIHEIDDGDYQGTLVYVIAEKRYQPSTYYYTKVYYGSCSGCDTLEAIRSYQNTPPSDEQVKDYMMLALHIVEGLKVMGE